MRPTIPLATLVVILLSGCVSSDAEPTSEGPTLPTPTLVATDPRTIVDELIVVSPDWHSTITVPDGYSSLNVSIHHGTGTTYELIIELANCPTIEPRSLLTISYNSYTAAGDCDNANAGERAISIRMQEGHLQGMLTIVAHP